MAGAPNQHPDVAELARSGLVDAAWYRARYPDVVGSELDPVEHFLRYGWIEGRWPNRFFDIGWYGREYLDVTRAGLNPLVHYLRHGEAEGRRPHPLVDPTWYRSVYEPPPETLALSHFLRMRGGGRHAPSAALWAVLHMPGYGVVRADAGGIARASDAGTNHEGSDDREANDTGSNDAEAGDAGAAGARRDEAAASDPISHYLDDAAWQQHEPFPDLEIVAGSGLIDPNFYLINASDVHAADVEPAAHYCHYGWREGRRPSIYFDPDWYVRTNPDLARLQVNPLVHYILVGEPADRRPVPYFEPGWYRRSYGVPSDQTALAHYLSHRRSQSVSPTRLFDVGWYVAEHAGELGPNRDPFAHYLQAGTFKDIDPSRSFDARAYRRSHLGRASRSFRRLMSPDRDNPLVHRMRTEYGSERPAGVAP
jgi:hypothetical protein